MFGRKIPTHFNERKATAAAGFFLEAAGGRMQLIRLLKLMYMADRKSWARYGRPITGDQYVSMNYGPVLSQTYDFLDKPPARVTGGSLWRTHICRAGDHDVALIKMPDLGPLAEAEVEILGEIHDRFRGMKTWGSFGLINYLHGVLKEWKNPKGTSIPISPEDILRVVGRASAIDSIREDMREYVALQRLIGAR